MPTNRPIRRKSFVWHRPVAKTMAFGGVAIGRHIAAEADRAIGIAIRASAPTTIVTLSGITMFAAAVLLMKLESKTVAKDTTIAIPAMPKPSYGMCPTIQSASPVMVTTWPSARPPASRKSTS